MILAVFAAYLLPLLLIGGYCSRYNRNIGDFVLGGRRLGPWVAAFSAQASDFSGWLLIGLPAAAYAFGFSMIWACIGCTCGVMFNWLVLARRLRRLSAEYGALTIPDFLEARYADRSRLIRILSVLIIVVYYVSYIAAQFNASGHVFATAFRQAHLPWGETIGGVRLSFYHQGMLIGATVILAYTATGGFLAVCWTDFVQAILMVGAVIALPVLGIIHLGGLEELWSALAAGALKEHMLAIDGGKAGTSFLLGVALHGLSWSVGYPGQPHIIARFMAIEEEKKIPKSALIAVIWTLFALYGSLFVGLVAVGTLQTDLVAAKMADRAMPMLAVTLFPPFFAGLALSAAIAAMMSTVDSQIIVAVAAVVRDGYEKLFGGRPSDRTAVWLSRAVVILLGVGGVAAAWGGQRVYGQVLAAGGGLAAGLGPAIVLGCLWKRTSRVGVIVGMITGVAMVQGWSALLYALEHALNLSSSLVQDIHAVKLLITVLTNFVCVVLVSLVFPARSSDGASLRDGNG